MQVDLAVQAVRDQAAFGVVQGYAGFIAAGFEAEYAHRSGSYRSDQAEGAIFLCIFRVL
jgi:hypothetical protein